MVKGELEIGKDDAAVYKLVGLCGDFLDNLRRG